MNDKNFQKLVDLTRKRADQLRVLCNKVDLEYTKRIVVTPQDNQDDIWISSVHLGEGESSITDLLNFAEHRKLNPPT